MHLKHNLISLLLRFIIKHKHKRIELSGTVPHQKDQTTQHSDIDGWTYCKDFISHR